VKKVLFTVLCAALLMSCASKGTAMADYTLTEAKVLQAIAKNNGLSDLASLDSLVAVAEKQNTDNQTTAAFLLADEAVLQFQIALQKQENKNLADSLEIAKGSLKIHQTMLEERKAARRK